MDDIGTEDGLIPSRTLINEYDDFIDLLLEVPSNYVLYRGELQQIKDYRDSYYETKPRHINTQSKFASIAFEAMNYNEYNDSENAFDSISMNLGVSLNDLERNKNEWVRFFRNEEDANHNEVLCCMLRDDNDHSGTIEHNDKYYHYHTTLLIFINDGEIYRLPIYNNNTKYYVPSVSNSGGNPFGTFNLLEIFQTSRTKKLYVFTTYFEVGLVMVEKKINNKMNFIKYGIKGGMVN